MDGSSEHDARLQVRGGRRLAGRGQSLSGAKNSALKLLAASLLTTEPCVIRRVPRITDVGHHGRRCCARLGAERRRTATATSCACTPAPALTGCAPYELVRTHARQHHRHGPAGGAPRRGHHRHAGRLQHRAAEHRLPHPRPGEARRAHRHRPRLHPRPQPSGLQGRRGPARLPQRGRHREPRSWRPRPPRARRSSRTPRASPRSSTSATSSAAWARTSRAPAPAPSTSPAAGRCTASTTRSSPTASRPAPTCSWAPPPAAGHDRRAGPGPPRAVPRQAARHGRAGGGGRASASR